MNKDMMQDPFFEDVEQKTTIYIELFDSNDAGKDYFDKLGYSFNYEFSAAAHGSLIYSLFDNKRPPASSETKWLMENFGIGNMRACLEKVPSDSKHPYSAIAFEVDDENVKIDPLFNAIVNKMKTFDPNVQLYCEHFDECPTHVGMVLYNGAEDRFIYYRCTNDNFEHELNSRIAVNNNYLRLDNKLRDDDKDGLYQVKNYEIDKLWEAWHKKKKSMQDEFFSKRA